MNTEPLKYVALGAMLVDHIGVLFIGSEWSDEARLVGRLALPWFVWLVALGVGRTSDVRLYERRLLLFAIVSQPVYWMFFRFAVLHLNVLFTLALGVAFASCRSWARALAFVFSCGVLAWFGVTIDGGFLSVVAIVLLSIVARPDSSVVDRVALVGAGAMCMGLAVAAGGLAWLVANAIAVVAFPLVACACCGSNVRRLGWAAYWFYPLHLFALCCVRRLA